MTNQRKQEKSGYFCQVCHRLHRTYSKVGKNHTWAIGHRETQHIRDRRQ